MQIKPLRRADTTVSDYAELANVCYNDKYVLQYEFGSVGMSILRCRPTLKADNEPDDKTAISEFTTLLKDLESVGLNIEVRPGYDKSILVFVQAPRALLSNMVYKSRYGSHMAWRFCRA